jgi:hypothetical protein
VFSAVTLPGGKDVDFFGVNRNTALPLIGISVPITCFFGAGATLVPAIYIYFHLYLVQLRAGPDAAPGPHHPGSTPFVSLTSGADSPGGCFARWNSDRIPMVFR